MPPRIRKAPIRTCVVCQQPRPKKELLRVVRTPAGQVEIDPTGKRSGRGAYVCSRLECRTGPEASRRLGRALGTAVPADLLPVG